MNKEMAGKIDDEVKKALEVIRKGGIILYPTDTIWGIGCDAANSEAVKKIFKLKQREDSKSLILLTADLVQLERTVGEIPEAAEQLIEVAVNPLTIVYDHGYGVAPECLAADGSVGVRIPDDEFCRKLCRALRRPLVSTSANISGKKAPANFKDIAPEILEGVDLVVDLRREDRAPSKASDIIKVTDSNVITIIR